MQKRAACPLFLFGFVYARCRFEAWGVGMRKWICSGFRPCMHKDTAYSPGGAHVPAPGRNSAGAVPPQACLRHACAPKPRIRRKPRPPPFRLPCSFIFPRPMPRRTMPDFSTSHIFSYAFGQPLSPRYKKFTEVWLIVENRDGTIILYYCMVKEAPHGKTL